MNKKLIKLSIVDDHKLVVDSLSKLINESGIAKITNVYYNLKSCQVGLDKELPDVLLLDIGLPDGDGVKFCSEIMKIYPDLKIIMLTSYKEFNIAKRALHYGALGYILKNSEIEEMLIGIETVSEGKQFLCEEINILLKEKRNEEVIWLANREREILGYIAEGYTSKEIGNILFISEETVRTYRRNLLIKLNARNTAEAVKKGFDMKLLG